MTIPHFKVAKGSKGITTSLFCLNNRMPQKNLICHLFARTVKCCVDTELFLVKMQKKCQISPTLANWPLAWLAGATQGRLKNSPIFSFPLFPLSSFTKFSPNSSCSAVSRFPEERWLWWAAQQSFLKKWKPFFDVSSLKAVVKYLVLFNCLYYRRSWIVVAVWRKSSWIYIDRITRVGLIESLQQFPQLSLCVWPNK